MCIENKISADARNKMQIEIDVAGNNEVFFRGIPDENGIVTDVITLARGNKSSVPAILKAMKKNEVIIHNHPSGYLYPSDADVEIAAIYSNKSNGASYIINNDVTQIYVIVELLLQKNIDIDIVPYFEENGILSQFFKEFEYREEQKNMAQLIEKGINTKTKVVVESGTGTGKTLAYLIPSIEWGIKNNKKIIISTNTINLQEQILNKDIPLAQKVINQEFKYSLIKGRGNYLCNRKHSNIAFGSDILNLDEFNQLQKAQLKELVSWGKNTKSGDKAELPFETDYNVWEHFQSENDMCAGSKCSFREDCFFLKAKIKRNEADVLVTNHHIYFADLVIRKELGFDTDFSILPEYGLAVFDEAHNVEKVARDYFSYEISKYSFVKMMNQIYPSEKKKKKGSLNLFIDYLGNKKSSLYREISKELENNIVLSHRNLFLHGRNFFNFLIEIFSKGQISSITYRLKKDVVEKATYYKELHGLKTAFISEISLYLKHCKEILKKLVDDEDENGIIGDFSRHIDRVSTFTENFKFINLLNDESFIYWLEVNGKKNNSKLVATPLKINNELNQSLHINLERAIFTSATIALGDDFTYFKESIGITENVLEAVIPSPFDYDNQMISYLPNDIINPSDQNFNEEISEFIKNLIISTSGKCFVLFTSYSALNYIYYTIRDELEAFGLTLFIQGETQRTQLINMYKTSENPVLFGTDSFWEGVDIRGEQLSSVIIVKIPFKVPNDPITEAIIENITKENKNAFLEFQIPEAVIKFKQGVGRLIRSKTDSGIITVLDNRIITKQYGKYFRDAIPTKNKKIMSKVEILNDILKNTRRK